MVWGGRMAWAARGWWVGWVAAVLRLAAELGPRPSGSRTGMPASGAIVRSLRLRKRERAERGAAASVSLGAFFAGVKDDALQEAFPEKRGVKNEEGEGARATRGGKREGGSASGRGVSAGLNSAKGELDRAGRDREHTGAQERAAVRRDTTETP